MFRGRGVPQQLRPQVQAALAAGCKMVAGRAYMARHIQVTDVVYRTICAWKSKLQHGWSRITARILWDIQIQTYKLVMANQPDIVRADR